VVCAFSLTVILVLSLIRLLKFATDMRRDFLDPGRAFGFSSCSVLENYGVRSFLVLTRAALAIL
jgi:hypothetical protein